MNTRKLFLVSIFLAPLLATLHIISVDFPRFAAVDSFSDAMKFAFERNGFIIIEGFLTHDQCKDLQKEAQNIVAAFDPTIYCSVFNARALGSIDI